MQNDVFATALILITVGLNTLAQIFLKLGSGHGVNLYLLGGILVYGVSTIFYILVLGKFNLSITYPIVIGLTVISTTITATFFLGEKITNIQWIGVGLLLSGITAIASGMNS
jgi:multidrug transporter EmrE-like cation transporter